MTPPVRVAMAGLGSWGPNLLRNLRENPRCAVVALCDRSPAALAALRPLHPQARLHDSVESLASDPAVDAVVLATPAGLHERQALLLLEAGKDVLVEKPLALSLEGAMRLDRRARQLGRVLMTGHTFLFNNAVRRTRELIADGTLGPLKFVTAARLSLGRIRTDCNVLWNLAPHDVSILLHWFGELPTLVSARGYALHPGHRQEDLVFATLEFPGGRVATIQLSWLNPVKVRQMTIVGSRCMLVYDDVDTARPLMLFHGGVEEVAVPDPGGSFERFQLRVRQGISEPVAVAPAEPLAQEIDHFLDCLESRAEPIGSGLEGLRVISVLEALQRSIEQKGAAVAPEVPTR